MTTLSEHVERIRAGGGDLLEWTLESAVEIDGPAAQGFAMAAMDGDDRVMIVEVSISGDRKGITAVITTYGPDGSGQHPSVSSMGHQTMVTIDAPIERALG